MSEYWEDYYHRAQQSLGVWGTFAPALTVGEITLANHSVAVADLQIKANERDVHQDVVDMARSARTSNLAFMEELCVRFPRKLEGDLPPTHVLHAEISDLRAIIPDSMDSITARSRRTISLWNLYNTQRAAAQPALPAYVVGGLTVALLETALTDQHTLLQNIENERGKLTQKRQALRALAGEVDDNNKRWYAAWEGEFPVGSAERAALSQIDTGNQTPLPYPLEINTIVALAGGAAQITYVPGGGGHATSFVLRWRIEGVDADYLHEAVLNLAGQTVATTGVSGQIISFKARATNSTGSTEGAVKQVVIP